MRKASAGLVLVVLCSFPLLAGEYVINSTGQTAYGLRVLFSEAVTITGFGDLLTAVEPEGESTEFTFAGGAVEAWGSHWLNWEPATAAVLEFEWLCSTYDPRGTCGLLRSYALEFHDSFDSPTLQTQWQIDDPRWKENFDPSISVQLIEGAIRIQGVTRLAELRQSGFRLSGLLLDGNADFEVVLAVTASQLEPMLVIELNGPISHAALLQLKGNLDGLELNHYAYDPQNQNTPVVQSTRLDGPVLLDGALIRLAFDAAHATLSCQIGNRHLRPLTLTWVPEVILLRVFIESSERLQGAVDMLIEEVHVGSDAE